MAISFNPQIKFTSETAIKKDSSAQPAATQPAQAPSSPIVETPKKAPVRGFISKLAYAWINLSEGARGVVNGLVSGAIVGTIVGGSDWLVSGLKKAASSKNDFKFADMFKHPTKALSKVGKIYAPIMAGTFFVTNLILAKLEANKRTANVDHQLYTNHRAN